MSTTRIQDMYELSPLQQGMLFHALLEPESHLYLEQIVIPFQGRLDVRAFQAAWQDVVDRNDVLRTSFHWEDIKKPVQVVHETARVRVTTLDLEASTPEGEAADVERVLARDQAEGIALDRPPLLRVTLLHMSATDYRLVLSFHHIILDGWSLQLVFRQVSDAYVARLGGGRAELPPTRKYRDYISWLQDQDLDRARVFWQRTLAGYEGPEPIWGRSHGVDSVPEFGEKEFTLSAATSAALAAASARYRLTVNTLAQGAWAAVLSELTGSDDVVFGVTVSGRPVDLGEVEAMVGLFINTIPLRVRIPARDPLLNWLRAIQEHQVEARQFEFTPLVQIQQWSEVPRGAPLFNTILGFENYPVGAGAGTTTGGQVTFAERTNYPLSVIIVPGDPVRIRLLYDRRLLEPTSVEVIARRFQQLLGAFAADPSRRILDLPEGCADDDTLLARINDTHRAYPDQATVHRLFEERAAVSPDAVAVECDGRHWSYRELDRLANALRRRLRSCGVDFESPVALLLDRSPEMVTAMLATLKAGGAYVPLDPANPPERLQAITTATNSGIVLTSETYAPTARALGVTAIVVDLDGQEPPADVAGESGQLGHPDQLAYIMYTSGSTGEPKGIAVTHRGVVRLVRGADYLALEASDRVGHLSNGAFDAATFEIWGPLLNGGCVVIIGRDTVLSPDSLATELRAKAVTVLFVTTALLNKIASQRPDAFSLLRCLLFGGEAVDPRWVARILETGAPGRLLHVYGPTESTTFATWHPVRAVPPGAASIPIGRPIANTRAYVLNRYHLRVPRAGVGELHLGADGLARGYLGEPRRTAESFRPDPSGARPGARTYATGDRVRLLPDGQLEFIGRLDDQVKLRGYRIELGEVAQVLRSHPDVRDSLAVLQSGHDGEKRLVAYVAADAEGNGSLRAQLSELVTRRLPHYMRPSSTVVVPALPLNANGKVDRRSLPQPDASRPALGSAFLPPDNLVEERLAEIWCEVLALNMVGRNDDFFELGGHSLKATQLISRIRRVFGVELELRAIFEHPTVAQLADRLSSAAEAAPRTPDQIPRLPRDAHRSRLDPPSRPGSENGG
jgi:amino acid adenylation domain-containing protein